MNSIYEGETIALKSCGACAGGLLESDSFCRWCGARQSEAFGVNHLVEPVVPISFPAGPASAYATTLLQKSAAVKGIYHSVSGPLVEAVIAGVSTNSSRQFYGRAVRKTILALVSIPIWMIIVMLSPLDAYVAAKAIAKEI